MPGQPLDIDLPLQSDNVSDAMAKISDSLQVIETDLEAKVVAAEIDINGNLDFNGWALIGATVITLEQVADANDFGAGSAVYAAGEWYLVTADGAVQITLNGAIDASGIGGIVGDYGGVNPAAVTYVDSAGVYQFTEAPGVWADVEVDDVILHGTAGTVRLACHSSVDTAPTISFTEPPLFNGSLVRMDIDGKVYAAPDGDEIYIGTSLFAGAAFFDSVITFNSGINAELASDFNADINVNTADINVENGNVVIDGGDLNLITGDYHFGTNHEATILPTAGMEGLTVGNVLNSSEGGVSVLDSGVVKIPFQLDVGSCLLDFKYTARSNAGTGDLTSRVRIVHADGTTTDLGSTTQTNMSTSFAPFTHNITDYTLIAGDSIWATLTNGTDDTSIHVLSCALIYDRP